MLKSLFIFRDYRRTPKMNDLHPANHPRTCAVCHGEGWMPGPPIHSQANGRPVIYETVTPCTHHWTNDDPQPTLMHDHAYPSTPSERSVFSDR